MPVARQSDTDAEHRLYAENARWERNGVLFATAHVVGSDNNRPQGRGGDVPPGAAREYPARDAATLAWIAATFAEAERGGHRAVVSAVQRLRAKYGERAYLYALLDAGLMAHRLGLVATRAGWRCRATWDFDDQQLSAVLGVDGRDLVPAVVLALRRTADQPAAEGDSSQ